ncbi:N-acetylmuramoyl-L-alanine amidase, partial [Salmonella enterica subsp. enterica serovar Anatum]|nr:N-acetylmuramoyl-L-alanine amidase [Salmonella enterica subsp. enterica serovar Anatum]
LNYDEIDMVLEGELHVRHEGETMIAKAGDVMFIPKGSSIEFGPKTKKTGSKRLVMLDPGHGGIDTGAIGRNGSQEKHVVLAIAK